MTFCLYRMYLYRCYYLSFLSKTFEIPIRASLGELCHKIRPLFLFHFNLFILSISSAHLSRSFFQFFILSFVYSLLISPYTYSPPPPPPPLPLFLFPPSSLLFLLLHPPERATSIVLVSLCHAYYYLAVITVCMFNMCNLIMLYSVYLIVCVVFFNPIPCLSSCSLSVLMPPTSLPRLS